MEKKYILSEERRIVYDADGDAHILHRVRAEKNFSVAILKDGEILVKDIHAGDYGGWVEFYHNLSQEGTAWVDEKAVVFGGGRVYDNAWVGGNAAIAGHARVNGWGKVTDQSDATDNVRIAGNARVMGASRVRGSVKISDFTVLQNALVGGVDVEIYGHAVIRNSTLYLRESDRGKYSFASTLSPRNFMV